MKKKTVRRSAGFVRTDTEMLDKLNEDFRKNAKARVHVGILGTTTGGSRESGKASNADIGAVHEFGVMTGYSRARSSHFRKTHETQVPWLNIPARSWLRMPVLTHMPDEIKRTGKAVWHEAIVRLGVLGALKLLGVFAVRSIQMAFATGGFGAWEPYSEYTLAKKTKEAEAAGLPAKFQLLVVSGQLRQSVTSEVKK